MQAQLGGNGAYLPVLAKKEVSNSRDRFGRNHASHPVGEGTDKDPTPATQDANESDG